MKINYLFLLISIMLFFSCESKKPVKKVDDKITVAAYYFPNYHTGDPHNDLNMGKDYFVQKSLNLL